jgi:hypothetical protein
LSWISHKADPLRALKARSRLAASPVAFLNENNTLKPFSFWHGVQLLLETLEFGIIKGKSMWKDLAMIFTALRKKFFGRLAVQTNAERFHFTNTLALNYRRGPSRARINCYCTAGVRVRL